MTRQIKPPSMMLASHIRVPVLVLAVPVLFKLLTNAPGKAEDSASSRAPVAHVGDANEFWEPAFSLDQPWSLWPFERVIQRMKNLFFSLSFCLSNNKLKNLHCRCKKDQYSSGTHFMLLPLSLLSQEELWEVVLKKDDSLRFSSLLCRITVNKYLSCCPSLQLWWCTPSQPRKDVLFQTYRNLNVYPSRDREWPLIQEWLPSCITEVWKRTAI